jgi:hypothetical protein
MSHRSKSQKEMLAAARAKRHEEDPSSSPASLKAILAAQKQQLQITESALDYTKEALAEARIGLVHEKQHAVDLYHTLHVVKRKQQRTQSAKVEALAKAIESMSLVEQLQSDNMQLQIENS